MIRTRFVFFHVAVGWICLGSTPAQQPPELARSLWSAQWISLADAPQRDQVVLHFRKLIELAAKPEHFVVQVSADNQFILYVNGEWAGAGPAQWRAA